MQKQTTEKLIEEIKKGDQVAMNALLSQWYSRICQYAYRYTGDKSLSKEICQQTFITVFKKLNQLENPAKFRPWVFSIVINCCKNHYRSLKYHDTLENTYVSKMVSIEPNAHERLVKAEKVEQLKKALQKIPNDQRTVIILKVYEGMKFREIADILETSENTVKSRMYYGLTALKKTLVNDESMQELNYGATK